MPRAGVLQGGGLGEPDDAVLGGDVGDGADRAVRAEYRGHVDDRAAAGGEHRRDLGAHAVEDAGEVDRDHGVPAVEREGVGEGLLAADAGVVDRHVQSAEGVDRVGDHRLAGRQVRHVDADTGARRRRCPWPPASPRPGPGRRSGPGRRAGRGARRSASPMPEPPPVTMATLSAKSESCMVPPFPVGGSALRRRWVLAPRVVRVRFRGRRPRCGHQPTSMLWWGKHLVVGSVPRVYDGVRSAVGFPRGGGTADRSRKVRCASRRPAPGRPP